MTHRCPVPAPIEPKLGPGTHAFLREVWWNHQAWMGRPPAFYLMIRSLVALWRRLMIFVPRLPKAVYCFSLACEGMLPLQRVLSLLLKSSLIYIILLLKICIVIILQLVVIFYFACAIYVIGLAVEVLCNSKSGGTLSSVVWLKFRPSTFISWKGEYWRVFHCLRTFKVFICLYSRGVQRQFPIPSLILPWYFSKAQLIDNFWRVGRVASTTKVMTQSYHGMGLQWSCAHSSKNSQGRT